MNNCISAKKLIRFARRIFLRGISSWHSGRQWNRSSLSKIWQNLQWFISSKKNGLNFILLFSSTLMSNNSEVSTILACSTTKTILETIFGRKKTTLLLTKGYGNLCSSFMGEVLQSFRIPSFQLYLWEIEKLSCLLEGFTIL